MSKPINNGRITKRILLWQNFNITVLDKLVKKNTVVDFVSRMQNINTKDLVEDSFLDEYPFAISTKSPWFIEIANYFSTRKFPP